MKKSNVKWIVLGAAALSLAAFSIGMTYTLNRLKKIKTEDLAPEDEGKEELEEEPEA